MLFRPWNVFCTFTIALSEVNVRSAQYGHCLQFHNSVISRYVAQVLSEWFWNGSIRPYYYFGIHISHALNFCYEVLKF